MKITRSQSTFFRLRRSGLVDRFDSAETAAGRLLGIQAQLPPASALATWNRVEGLTRDALQESLAGRRTLVRLWGQRNTVHVYRSSDWPLFHGAFRETGSVLRRRLAKKPDLERQFEERVAEIRRRLEDGETLSYRDVGEIEGKVDIDGWVVYYAVFLRLVRDGVAAHALPEGQETRFVHRERWLPDLEWHPPGTESANVEVARRYLRAYGPATAQDLAFWHGATVARARRWLGALGDEVVVVEVDGVESLVLREDLDKLAVKPPPPSRWPCRLLHRFDPLLLATKDKTWLIDDVDYKRVWRPAAQVATAILDRGRIAGTWRYDRRASGVRFTLEPFKGLRRAAIPRLEAQARGIAAFLGSSVAEFIVEG